MNDENDAKPQPAEPGTAEPKDIARVVSTLDLFAGAREICIEHEGERYVLRITRRGKLILQK